MKNHHLAFLNYPGRYFAILLFMVFIWKSGFCQEREKENIRSYSLSERLIYGGNFGVQFGTYTLLDVSPLIGYRVSRNFDIGISPTYKFYSFRNSAFPDLRFKTHVFGGSIFSRYFPFESIFVHGEYEYLYYSIKYPTSNVRVDYNSLLIGPGYRQQLGPRSYMNLMLLWNLNDTPDSPYTNPVIKAGFTIGH